MAMLNTLDILPEDPAELRQVSELLAAEGYRQTGLTHYKPHVILPLDRPVYYLLSSLIPVHHLA